MSTLLIYLFYNFIKPNACKIAITERTIPPMQSNILKKLENVSAARLWEDANAAVMTSDKTKEASMGSNAHINVHSDIQSIPPTIRRKRSFLKAKKICSAFMSVRLSSRYAERNTVFIPNCIAVFKSIAAMGKSNNEKVEILQSNVHKSDIPHKRKGTFFSIVKSFENTAENIENPPLTVIM